MPTSSIVVAFLNKIASLNPANFPDGSIPAVYFGDAPQVNSTAVQLYPPYIALFDDGQSQEYASNFVLERTKLRLHVFYEELGDCETAVLALKYNGQSMTNAAGLDFGSFAMGYGYTVTDVRREPPETRKFAGVNKAGGRTHLIEMKYKATVQKAPT